MEDRLSNVEVVGERILIRCVPHTEEAITNSNGVIVSGYKISPNEAGRLTGQLDIPKYSTVAHIIQIPKAAMRQIEKFELGLKVGDKIWVAGNALHDNNRFITIRDKIDWEDEGYYLIPIQYIEAKIKE